MTGATLTLADIERFRDLLPPVSSADRAASPPHSAARWHHIADVARRVLNAGHERHLIAKALEAGFVPVTGKTITDEQIRQMRDDARADIQRVSVDIPVLERYDRLNRLNGLVRRASVALGERRAYRGSSRAADRQCCAAAWNARHAPKVGS